MLYQFNNSKKTKSNANHKKLRKRLRKSSDSNIDDEQSQLFSPTYENYHEKNEYSHEYNANNDYFDIDDNNDNDTESQNEVNSQKYNEYSEDDSSEYHPSSSELSSEDSQSDNTEGIKQELMRYGLMVYLKSRVGGEYSDSIAKQLLQLTITTLQYTYQKKYQTLMKENMTIQWFALFITEEYALLESYVDEYLIKVKQLSPSTIINKLNSLHNIINWFILWRKDRDHYIPVSYDDCRCFMDLSSAIRKCEKKKARRVGSENNDIKQLINQRKLPAGGLQELYDCCHNEMSWARKVGNLPLLSIDRKLYLKFIQLLYSSFYVCNVQGRISGIHDMKYHQGKELLENGCAMSSVFKTQSKYGFQPVSVGNDSSELLQIYMRNVRKAANNGNNPQPYDPLFITYAGEKETDIGRHVTQYFRDRMKLSITTTKIRSLIETEAEDKFQKQLISKEERQSIMNINGHTSQIVQDYYIKRDRHQDVQNARNAIAQITNQSDEQNIISEDYDYDFDFDIDYENGSIEKHTQSEWGSCHPNQNPNAKRVQWSEDELNYLKMLRNEKKLIKSAHCLKAIMNDPACYKIFHVNHIMNSGRLRNGIDNLLREGH